MRLLPVERCSTTFICMLPLPTHTQCISASEFIRGHISSGGFSDPRTGKTHTISDVSYIVTGHLDNQSGGVVDGRLLKHFNVLHWDGYKYAHSYLLIFVCTRLLIFTGNTLAYTVFWEVEIRSLLILLIHS